MRRTRHSRVVAVVAASAALCGVASSPAPASAGPTRATVTSLSAHGASTRGGAVVVVRGRNLGAHPLVRFGDKVAHSRKVSATTIRALVPALYRSGNRPVTVHVSVNNRAGAGRSRSTAANRFTYAGSPTITAMSVHSGPAAGGTKILIRGTGFYDIASVRFDNAVARAVRRHSGNSLTVTAPARPREVRTTVTVETYEGTSRAWTPASIYRFLPRPVVTSVHRLGFEHPEASTSGGSRLGVCGQFGDMWEEDPVTVSVNGTKAPAKVIGNCIDFVAPHMPAGPANVRVTTPGGVAAATAAARFEYRPPGPTLSTPRHVGLAWNAGWVQDISCPETRACFAIDPTSFFVLADAGWVAAPSPPIGSSELSALSCATSTTCLAATYQGAVFRWDGTTWTSLPRAGASTKDLSCVAPTSCVAVGTEGMTRWDGTTWSRVTGTGIAAPRLLECPTLDVCVIADDAGRIVALHDDTVVSSVQSPNPVSDLDCSSDTFCVAVNQSRSALVLDGGAWHATALPMSDARRIACAQRWCTAYNVPGQSTDFDGTSWTAPVPGTVTRELLRPSALDCAERAACVVGDETGLSLVRSGDGWRPVLGLPSRGYFLAADCAGDRCAAQDSLGNLTIFDRSVRVATTRVFASPAVGGDVDCVSPSFCLAVSSSGEAAVFDGTAWIATAATGAALYRVACASPSYCVGVGSTQTRVYSAGVWTDADAAPFNAPWALAIDMSCTATTCIAIRGGRVATLHGTTWTVEQLTDQMTSWSRISCTTAACVFLDETGVTFVRRDAAWRRSPSLPVRLVPGLFTMSCATTTFCAVVSYHQVRVWTGTTWTSPATFRQDGLHGSATEIACGTTGSCMYFGDRYVGSVRR